MRVLVQLTTFLTFALGATGGSVNFSDCGSDYKIQEVDVESCTKLNPCRLQIGKSYQITLTLKPSYRSDTLSQTVHMTIFDVEMPLIVTPDNPCLSLNCPVQVGNGIKYKATLYLGNDLLPTKGELWWKLTTNTNRVAVCMRTYIRLTGSKYDKNLVKRSVSLK